jgi:hypothetical protein
MGSGKETARAALCALLVGACGSGGAPAPYQPLDAGDPGSQIDPSKISLVYVCGNRFRTLNSQSISIAVTWAVENSGDHGELTLPASPVNQPWSETFFSTQAIGTVVLTAGGRRITSASNLQQTCTPPGFSLVQVATTPAATSMFVSTTQLFSAQVTGDNDTAVLWSVQEGSFGGFVDASGLYTAPAIAGTFHVVATSHADPTRSAAATVTVRPRVVAVTVEPGVATVISGGIQLFSAQVSGTADTALLWSVQEGFSGGTIDATGLYTAPPAAGTFHVVATSHADPRRSATATVSVESPPPPRGAFQVGRWGAPQTWPIVPIHAALLYDGRVLAWSRLGKPQVWDPASDTFLEVPSPSWEFCAGAAFLPNGQLVVAGGHLNDDYGIPDVNLFDPATSSWVMAPPMAAGRWYPTVITLADGSVVVVAGNTADANSNLIPEVRNADGTWRELTGAQLQVPYYPNLFLAPDGRVFMAGSDRHSRYLDTQGTGAWGDGPTARWGNRDYGTAVMYDPGKVLIAGGGWTPTNTVELINLNDRSPSWRFTQSMFRARRMVTSTVLPDGKVLITGGTSGTGFNDQTRAVFSAELWDPATEKWTELSSMRIFRVYHSVALLLPDARVLVGGGGEGANGTVERNIEMFSPPYLFNQDGSLATRPTISSAPVSVAYGTSFQISSPEAAAISSVALVRLGSVTHSFNTTQLRVPLAFTVDATGSLSATAPANGSIAPPGHYMLFLVDAQGVPSIARIVQLK